MSDTYDVLVRDRSRLRLEQRRTELDAEAMRVLLVGICGTDLQILRQVRPDPALVLGHEGLAEARTDAGELRHVVFNPVDKADQDRILGHTYDGLLRKIIPGRETPRLFDVDPALPADLAVLIEPLAAVLYGWQLMTATTSVRTLGIWGAGTTAVLMALVAETHGVAARVYHDRPARLRCLRELAVIPAATLQPAPSTAGEPGDLDAAALCVVREGARNALTQALSLIRPGGVVDLLGGFASGDRHPDLPSADLNSVRRANVCGSPNPGQAVLTQTRHGRQVWLVGHRGTADRHFRAAQRMLMDNPERFGRVLTHVVSLPRAATLLPQLADASDAGRARRDPCIKVVVDMALSADSRAPSLSRTVADLGEGL